MTYQLTFKTDKGLYKNFTKTFKDEKHYENFVDKMQQLFGWKLVGTI